MVQAQKERPARLALRRKVAISWSNRACSSGAFSTHPPLIMACLHLVLSPCCTARTRATKHFLHTWHWVSATKCLASPRLPCALFMCVRNAASDAKVVSHIVQICTVDTAVATSPKLYAGKSRAHAAFTIVCHALGNSILILFQGTGSALNSGRSLCFHRSLARRACKSSMISAIHGVVFPPAFCRRTLSCGDSARAARATCRNRSRRSNVATRAEFGVCCPVSCTSASPRTFPQHSHVSRVEAPQHCRRARAPDPRGKEQNGPQQRVRHPQLGP